MSITAEQLLSNHQLRNTASRISILSVFISNNFALSHSDIEKELSKLDRVTIYRTLNSFLEKGIIHKVLDDAGATKYALCEGGCSSSHHHDNHVHFKCTKCQNSECLNDVSIPQLTLPSGYTLSEANLLIEGVCLSCNNK